ncbi:hypothetical protein [Pseudoalteromonas lipolytica]
MNDLTKRAVISSCEYFKECIDQTIDTGIKAGNKMSMNWLSEALNYPNRKKCLLKRLRYPADLVILRHSVMPLNASLA